MNPNQTSAAFIRLKDLASDRKNGRVGLLPLSKSTIWAGVKAKTFPQPVRLAHRITAWRMADIQKYIDEAA